MVRTFLSNPYGRSLNGMLPELAQRYRYRVLEGQETILKPCDTALVPVLLAAPN